MEQCKFEGLKGFLSRTDDHIYELQEEIKKKDEEVMFLRSMLASLSEKVEQLEKNAGVKIGGCGGVQCIPGLHALMAIEGVLGFRKV